MKAKISILVLFVFLSLGAVASDGNNTNPKENANQRVTELVERVNEINKMDFKKMDRVEKKAIKKELKTIKKELKAEGLDDKVSISVGAIIIIILLLIII